MKNHAPRVFVRAIATALVAAAAATAQVTIDSADVAGWIGKEGEFLDPGYPGQCLAEHPLRFGGQQTWDFSWILRDSSSIRRLYYTHATSNHRSLFPGANAVLGEEVVNTPESRWTTVRVARLTAGSLRQLGFMRTNMGDSTWDTAYCPWHLLPLLAYEGMFWADTAQWACTDRYGTWHEADTLECHSYGAVRLPGGAVLTDVLGIRLVWETREEGTGYAFSWYSKALGLVARLKCGSVFYPGDTAYRKVPYLLTAGTTFGGDTGIDVWDLSVMYLTPDQGAVSPPSSGGLAKSGRGAQPAVVYTLAGRQTGAMVSTKAAQPSGVLVQLVDSRSGRTALVVR